jgi:two-component system sensor histidine kinase DegS
MLRVRDNGRGITGEERSSEGGIGLLGMRERAELIGATVDIIGSPGHGTEVVVRLPLGSESARADVTSQRRNSAKSASSG